MNIDPNTKYHSDHWSVLRKSEDDEKTEATVMPKDATGKEGRANHVDVARRSYLEALTRGRGQAHSFRFTKKVGLIYCYDSLFGWLLYRHHRYFVVKTETCLP